MEDQNNRDFNALNDTASMAPNLPSLNNADLASESRALRNRSSLMTPRRFRSLNVPKVERRVKISGSLDFVSLLLVDDIGVTICGENIGASGSHACVDAVIAGKTSCAVKSHNVFIRTPSVKGKHTVYLTPCLDITMLASEMIGPLLTIERTVEVWSSFLPRLPSLLSSEASNLIASIDIVLESKSSFKTPSKK